MVNNCSDIIIVLMQCKRCRSFYQKCNNFVLLFLGEIIRHGDYRCIPGEGMPQHKNPFEKGNLIIQFIVHFPTPDFLAPNKVGIVVKKQYNAGKKIHKPTMLYPLSLLNTADRAPERAIYFRSEKISTS